MIMPIFRKKGFTLLEILIVIAIMAILASIGWFALSAIKNSTKRKTAANEVALLNAAMQAYKSDNGNILPEARGDVESSNIMYKALYCDSKNAGKPDIDKHGVQRKPYLELTPMEGKDKKAGGLGIPVVKVKKKYYILDPWGEPYRYRPGYDTETEDPQGHGKGKLGDGFNPDFDIFSLGPDGRGDGRNNKRENEDNISNVTSWK